MASKNRDQNVIGDDAYESMSWHDCRIHAFALLASTHELALDIDYIVEWLPADDASGRFRFRLAPATLVFSNVYNIRVEIETDGPVEIQEIRREHPRRPKNFEHVGKDVEWEWTVETQQGSISFVSVGFSLFLRRSPEISDSQYIDRSDLSVCFSKT